MPASTQLPPFLANVLHGPTDHAATPLIPSSGASPQANGIQPSTTVAPLAMEDALTSAFLDPVQTESEYQEGMTVSSSMLVPPLNFDMVCAARSTGKGAIYRSGFPNERNFPFLATLQLRTVVYLSSDDIRPNLQQWVERNHGHVQLLHFRLRVNKEPLAEMDKDTVVSALEAILDRRNLPVLIHCNKGKYRVGVITALIRRLQGWSMTSIYDEYARFAGTDRVADEEFIDIFPLSKVRRSPECGTDWLT